MSSSHALPVASTSALPPRESSPPSSNKKRKSHKTGTVYSQPSDTGVGRHWATQLLFAVNFLKTNHPIRLEDLAIRSNVEALLTNAELLNSFQKHDRVVWDEKTDLYSYKPDFVLKSSADLLALLRRYAPRGGLSFKTLKESWPSAGTAIEELEKQGKVLVTRTGGSNEREGQIKAVFLDEIGLSTQVDKEFKDLWASLKTPIADELAEELRSAGLNAASSIATPVTALRKKNKGRKGANRRQKITNTHLKDQGIDLSKDYTPVRK